MLVDLRDAVLVPGDGAVNEDAFGWQTNELKTVMWALDGATDLDAPSVQNSLSDAAWYVAWWQRFLNHNALASLDWANLLADGVQDVIAMWAQRTGYRELPRHALPSAAGVWVRAEPLEAGWQLSTMHIGDCRGYWLGDNGDFIPLGFHGERAVDHNTPAAKAMYQKRHEVSLTDFRAQMLPYLQRSRATMNTGPDGYWILSLEPTAVTEFPQQTLVVDGSGHIILSTDGLFRFVDTFDVMDAHTLCRRLVNGEMLPLVQKLRAIEHADKECYAVPRYKTCDDISVAVWRLRTA